MKAEPLPAHPSTAVPGGGVSVARALFFVGVFYAVMVLLNGVSMQASASLAEFGPRRDMLLRLNRPLGALSRFTGGFRLREAVRMTAGSWLNREAGI